MVDNTAGDIRSVVKNATQGNWVAWANSTIATKEEINKKRWEVDIQTKIQSPISTQNRWQRFIQNAVPKKEEKQAERAKASPDQYMSTMEPPISKMQEEVPPMTFANQSDNPNELNQSGIPINNVEINGDKPKTMWQNVIGTVIPTRNVNSKFKQSQEEAKKQGQLDLWRGIRDLYTTAYSLYQNGQYLSLEYVREKFPEFNGISDEELYNLASDATYLATQGDYNLQNAFMLMDAYGIDANLLFDELDPQTKAAYLTKLSQGTQWQQSPWWLDRVVNFAVGQGLSMDDGDVALGDMLNNFSQNASETMVSWRQQIGADLVDLRNLYSKYSEYFDVVDKKGLEDFWKNTEKWINKEISLSEWDDLSEWGWWWQEIGRFIKWKDEDKHKEFTDEYIKWWNKDTKTRLKSFGQNALFNIAQLWIAAYNMVNHPIDTAGMIFWLWAGVIGNIWANTWIWSDEKWDEVMNSKTMNAIEDSGAVGQWFAGIMKNSKDSASYMWDDYIIPTYGSMDNFIDALSTRPFDVWSDYCTAMEAALKLGGKIKGTPLNEKVQVWVDKKWNPIMKTQWWVYGEQVAKLDPMVWFGWAGTKLGEVVIGAPFKVAGAVGKWVGNLIDSFVTKTTGLNEEQRMFIRENPELVSQFLNGEKTADDIANAMREKYGDAKAEKMLEGNIFKFLEDSDQKLDTRGMFYKLEDVFSELWVKIGKSWEIEFTKPLEESVKARIKKAYEYINSIANGSASVSDVHWAREWIGWLTKWDATHNLTPQEARLNKAMENAYFTVGEVLKEQVKGWAEADKAYHEILNVLQDFKEWFDKDGNLKDSAYSKISNYMNKNNKPKLERLLKYFPEFEKDLQALAVSKAIEKATNATAGQYLTALSSGVGWAALFGLFGGHVGLGKIASVLLASTYLTPKNFVKVLKAEGNLKKKFGATWESILKKLNAWKKLTEKEQEVLYDYLKWNKEALAKVEKKLQKEWKLPTKKEKLADLQQQKKDLKQLYKEGKITAGEYKQLVDEIDYDIATLKSRAAKWDVEYELKPWEAERVGEKYGNMAEQKLWFRKKLQQDMTAESQKAGTTVRWYADLKKKLYNLSKNPTSTTAQHEFFHAVMSVVDEKTRRYVLDEAKRIMKEAWMSDVNAEEWLAESFGIYAKRKDVKLGVLEKGNRSLGDLKNRVRDLFQRVYEWMQNYNGDRKSINKMFNEILNDKWTLDAEWKLDLSYILDDTNPWWLKNKLWLEWKQTKRSLYWSKDYPSGVAMKKDVGAVKKNDSGLPKIRYKVDVNGKEVNIDTKAAAPDQLAKVNDEGLSVMKSFISEKQAKKALDVSKDLLTKDGDAYLWTHTNKYNAPQFANFENYGDSKYKEFTNNEIAWLTNNEEMSSSYANWQSVLADTKPTTIKEINDKTFKTEKSKGVEVPLGRDKSLKANTVYENGEQLVKNWDKYELVKRNKMVYEFDENLDKILDDVDIAKEWYTWTSEIWEEEKMHPLTKEERIERLKFRIGGSYTWWKYDVDVKELPNGKTQITKSWKDGQVIKSFDSKEWALSDIKASRTGNAKYHYKWILQNMKKPLVVDMKWEWGATFWNRLDNAYDFLKENDEKGLKKLEEVNKKFVEDNKKYKEAQNALDQEAREIKKWYNEAYTKASEPLHNPKLTEAERKKILNDIEWIADDNSKAVSAQQWIFKMLYGYEKELNPIVMDWVKKHPDFNNLYWRVKDFLSKNEELNMLGNTTSTALISRLEGQWVDKATASLLHWMWYKWLQTDFVYALKDKMMQTNDYVFYALRKWDYDGVLFKNIIDYGEEPKGWWWMAQWWDVVAAFNSRQFKAWDNANPTDSKYISYKKDVDDSKKLIWLHNLWLEKLKWAVELGGMPMPSIAVTKRGVPHTSYGDITFIMKESAINPKLSRKNKLYTVDGYTPVQQQPVIRIKNTKEADALISKIEKETWMSYGEVSQWLEYHDDRYVEQYPKLKEFEKYYDDLTEKKLFDGYTYSGKRRYIDYNLDNIVKKMVGNKRDAFNGAFWKMVAQSEWSTTVDKLRERNFWLKDKDAAEKIWEKYYDALRELASKKWIEQKIETLSDYWRFAENVSDAYRPNTEARWRELTQWDGAEWTIYSKITKEDLEPLQKIVKEWAQMPRPYSEAKPERAVRWDEVGAVVAPNEKMGEVQEMMKDTWVKIYGYDEGKRMEVIDKVADENWLRFKKDTNSDWKKLSKWQIEYFKDSKVRDRFGRLTPVYHFTADDFNIVDFKKGSQNLFWFTSDGTASDRAQGVKPGMQRKRKDMYVDIKNPAGWEEYNKFWTDELKYRGYDGVILKNRDWSFEGFIFDKENQVKYTDNLNPTSSKDMRFKKDTWLDAEYEKAVKDGDNEKAMWLLRKRAAEMWYNSNSDYQGSKAFNGSAPSSEWYTKAERINPDTEMYSQTLGDYASDGVDLWNLEWQLTDRGNYMRGDAYARESIDNLNKAVREYKNWNKNAKITMYRAIDANIKEDWFRNGDWITPSKKYAEHHIELQDWDNWRIISEEVPIENIWWDNNDINEWWYDDGKDYAYKNTKNNRKELWITRDNKGWLIPLSKRFDETNPDIRYKHWYHWSPYKFTKFDSSHMGEWEGAQAHWWGHYIAISKDTAKKYAQMGAGNTEFKWMPIFDFFETEEGKTYSKVEQDAIRMVWEYMPDYTAVEAIEQLPEDLYPPRTDYDRAVIRAIQNLDPDDFTSGRHLYDVDFTDPARADTPSGWNYLDEETPYSRKTFDKIFDKAKEAGWDESKAKDYIDRMLAFNGKDKMYGVWIRRALDDGFGEASWKKTSKFLESLGYEGIHYNWLEDGEAYVIFKDTNPEITKHTAFKKDVGLKVKSQQTNTPEFKKWFEGSKVVKADWKPQVVYHWTEADFTIFNKVNWPWIYGDGYYFTDKIWTAKSYGRDGKVMKVYLDIKNPYEATMKDQYGLNIKKLKEQWYDGVRAKLWNETYWVAFDSNQIKSATDNVGTFDKNNPDIRYKLDGKWVTTEPKLLVEDLKEIKDRGYGFYKWADWKIWTDRMTKIRKYIENDLWVRVHDYVRLDRNMIDWIMDKHGYDSELGYWKSLSLEDWEKMPEVIDSYDTIVSTSSSKWHPRYKLEKKIGNDTYHLVLELNEKQKQLVPITFYVNNWWLQRKFFNDVQQWLDHQKRKDAVKQYGKKYK